MNNPFPPSNLGKILTPKVKKNGKWQRKSNFDIENIKIKFRKSSFTNITMPLSAGIVVLIVLLAITSRSPTFPHAPLIPYRSYICILISLSVFVLTYIYQIFTGRALASSPSFKVCNKCFKEDYAGLRECPCGGILEPPEFYTFIEESQSVPPSKGGKGQVSS
ncbi:MAG: hypothetical protein ACP5IL_14480 [Syntrophobacteraceae bacterium]